jgi:hypothetical protein
LPGSWRPSASSLDTWSCLSPYARCKKVTLTRCHSTYCRTASRALH